MLHEHPKSRTGQLSDMDNGLSDVGIGPGNEEGFIHGRDEHAKELQRIVPCLLEPA